MFKKTFLFLVTVMFIFGISNLSFAMMCGGKMQEAQAQEPTATPQEKPVDVGNKICPVTGEKIEEKFKGTYEYKGKIYNFCCATCIEEFKKDPAKYIKKVEEELKSNSSGAVLQENKAMPESQGNEGMQESHHH